MLFQDGADNSLILIIGIIIGTIIVTLVMYLVIKAIESEHKASDKKFMILLLAFITVLLLPIVAGAIGMVLSALGDILVELRNLIDGGGRNFLVQLTAIIYFLMLLCLMKFLIDIKWESALWASLITLFIMYIIYTLIPELYIIVRFG